ncbi:hypothetical protein CFC21_011276 [Triticum aestivum]|uniref:At1g61320/AtMIF1 LRR domain-containing protein n=2 Tax=Triticum aestivum TaxID=4565 RepID=A0A3B5ZTV4_WHEAT|nr:hypothetical protein CFC21_011276 [Triticum aestivum]
MAMAKLRRLVRGPRTVREDRLSALSDDLLRLIVSRLEDTRTALSTAVLSRRWAHIPRELPALDLKVGDILPPEYNQTIDLRERNLPGDTGSLDGLMAHWELRSTRTFTDSIASLVAAGGSSDGDARRRAKTLRLEFFSANDGGCIDRLVAAAVGAWGVDDLEIVARPASSCHHEGNAPAHRFPHDLLDDGGRSRLRSLTLGNCTLPPLHTYEALTTLVLQDVAASTPVAVYERLFTDCTRLEVLHLKSCGCTEDLDHLVVDAPGSAIRELLVEECAFSEITLHALPMLARLACLGRTMMLRFGSVPSLTHLNLTFWEDGEPLDFLRKAPAATTNLVLRFTGPSRWVVPMHLATPFRGLKRLLVADLPSNWDVSWPRILLFFARSLEVLHIHVAHSDDEPGEDIWWLNIRKKLRRHRHMKELVIIGFAPTPRQKLLVKDALSMCRSLQRLVLLRDGHVRYNGLWEWEMVGQPDCPWSADDTMAVTKLINSASKPLLDVILG